MAYLPAGIELQQWYLVTCFKLLPSRQLRDKETKAETQNEDKHCKVKVFSHAGALCGADPSAGCITAQLACHCNVDLRNLGKSVLLLSSLPSSQIYFHLACY